MANRRKAKRAGWTRDGVKVRERVKGSGVWWVFINHVVEGPDGTRRLERKSVRKGSREAADAFANEIRAGFKLVHARQRALSADELQRIGLAQPAPAPAPEPGAGVTFGSYARRVLDRWEPNDKDPEHGLKFSTWRDYRGCLNGRLIPALGERPLASIKRRDIRKLADDLRAEGLSAVNVKKHLRIVSSILSEAADADELIPVNPMLSGGRRRRRSKEKQVRRRQDPFTAEELEALFATAESHAVTRAARTVHPFRPFIPLLMCLADTGMRLGEAFALTWGDVDWRSGTILIRHAYTQRRLDVPKGGKARKVEMTTRLRTTLRAIYEARFRRVAALDVDAQTELEADQASDAATALVFPDELGGYLDDSNLRRRVWAPLLAAAQLRGRRLHDLRHTFATLHLQGGTDPIWVSTQLGHHSVAFTLATYAHLPLGDRGGHADRIVTAPKCTATALATPEADDAAPGDPQQALAAQR